jgi:peptidoglycan/xylan/chitin deacetylase (PgdA/CDA1 family)
MSVLGKVRSNAKLWAGASWYSIVGQANRNRDRFYDGSTGLRLIHMHNTYPDEFGAFVRLATYCQKHFITGGPEDVDLIASGRFPDRDTDTVVFTFDDGNANNFAAASWMAEQGMRGIFFVTPPFMDRATRSFVEYHAQREIVAYPVSHRSREQPARGLSRLQASEMADMGHRIAAHNYAHRDLGELHDEADLRYEITNSLDDLGELLGHACDDFAIAFGRLRHVSDEAAAFLRKSCRNIHLAVRGLNVPGRTPAFYCRTLASPELPLRYNIASIRGALDHLDRAEVEEAIARFGTCPGRATTTAQRCE